MRRKSNWRYLTNAELRLLMSGLSEWERRSPLGPIRTRIRRIRREVVAFYRKHHGPLADDRLWVPAKLPKEKSERRSFLGRHDPRKENSRGVLWHET